MLYIFCAVPVQLLCNVKHVAVKFLLLPQAYDEQSEHWVLGADSASTRHP